MRTRESCISLQARESRRFWEIPYSSYIMYLEPILWVFMIRAGQQLINSMCMFWEEIRDSYCKYLQKINIYRNRQYR